MIRHLPKISGVLALAIAILSVALLSGRDASAQDSPYFQPCGSTTVTNPAKGAKSDIKTIYGVGEGDDCVPAPGVDNKDMYNVGGIIGFTPAAWGVPADADIPDGTEIGSLTANSTLGLLNNPCANLLVVNFKFYDGTTNQANGIDPLPSGTANRMKPLADDTDGDGKPDGATKWPNYLTKTFEHADLTKLRARYFGVATIPQAANLVVILNFLVFEPGATITDDPTLVLDPRMGYPSVTVLQDPTAAASSADFINDFCSPLLTNTTLLQNVRTNPNVDGTYGFVTAFASQRDADGDGFENGLDTCPYDQNVGNARNTPDPGDSDADGIDQACDPDPTRGHGTSGAGISNSDQDDDKWMNRGDNCPLVANPDQKDDDKDGIGDACDQHLNDANADGVQIKGCLKSDVVIGAGGAEAIDPLTILPCNPNAVLEQPTPVGQTPTPTLPPGATPRPTTASSGGSSGGVSGGPSGGVGSLSPTNTGVPLWAIVVSLIGALGIAGGGSLLAARSRKWD